MKKLCITFLLTGEIWNTGLPSCATKPSSEFYSGMQMHTLKREVYLFGNMMWHNWCVINSSNDCYFKEHQILTPSTFPIIQTKRLGKQIYTL